LEVCFDHFCPALVCIKLENKGTAFNIFSNPYFERTPGHAAFLLESGNARLLIWTDLAHAMKIQMPHQEVALKFDIDPAQAVETRKHIPNYVSENKLRIVGMYIEFPGVGDVTPRSQGDYQSTPVCLSEGL
jgi:hypothetical protein